MKGTSARCPSRRLDLNPVSLVLGCLSALLLALPGRAGPDKSAPLFKNLGNHHHPITTSSPRAQRYFDQGLTLLYAFNHAEAIRSFRAAARLDPRCAMAWWGVAYGYGPNINAPMTDEAVPLAWAALQNAVRLQDAVSAREAAYVTALTARYRREPVEDRSALDRAYAEAMGELSRSNPDDLDAATLYVEALMDTMPWDYWTEERHPKTATVEALSTLRGVLGRNPNHPGALHLYIHAVESGPRPELGIPSADRLRDLVPDAGHLVHMPSHIYLRVGDYHAASEANERAVKADKLEPPYWYYPVRQSLGAALLGSGRSREVEEEFREDLVETPRNGWALFGLAESLRRQGKSDAATSVQRELDRAWQHADADLDLSWF